MERSVLLSMKISNAATNKGIKKIEKENKIIFLDMKSGATIIVNQSS